nr:hypothetical protein [Cytophagales bacterium]
MKPFIWLMIAAFSTIACYEKNAAKGSESRPTEIPVQKVFEDTVILGIDVSHFQGDIDWGKIKSANIKFAYDKATQGSRYKDPKYVQNKQGAQNVGLVHGSYHFFTSNDSGLAQAEHFCQVVDYKEGDMIPVLDLEQGSIVGEVTVQNFQKEVFDWLNEVERILGVKPIIYTNHPFGDQYLDHPDFSAYELWIAEYGVSTPKIPKQWKEKGWLIWQRSERGKIEGAIGDVDHDLFNPAKPFGFSSN